jgi:hypothetical protein
MVMSGYAVITRLAMLAAERLLDMANSAVLVLDKENNLSIFFLFNFVINLDLNCIINSIW